MLPKDTPLPDGFTISKDLTDGKFSGHYSIRAHSDIHVDVWKKSLKKWAEEYAININDYRNSSGVKNV